MNKKREIFQNDYHLSYAVREGGFWVEPGEMIAIQIPDFHGFDANNEKVAGSPNPLAGPFLVKGAMPGDTLRVLIHSLAPNRRQGFACKDLHPNVHIPPLPLSARRKEYVNWEINTTNHTVKPDTQYFPGCPIELPLRPVLGCIGVAPGVSDRAPSNDCGNFGGNMDYARITAGATIYLPVYTENAYLYLGDGHAIQGDGEITGNGVEVSCDVSFSIEIDRLDLECLAGEDDEFLFTIGNDRPLEKGLSIATAEMFNWLISRDGLNENQAGILMGQLVRYEVGNIVSNAYCGACCFPKWILPK